MPANDNTFDADVIVVGLGAMGANAAWRLAARGLRVIGIERFEPGHVHGSSHGQSRLFRVACLEHPNLVTMARRSRELWLELESLSGEHIFDQTGAVTIGPSGGSVIADTLRAAQEHSLPVVRLTREEVANYSMGHENIPEGWEALWDPEGGVVRPEAGVTAATRAAEIAGATVYTDTKVRDIRLIDGGVEVVTATATFRARQAVVTAGAWLGKLLPDIPVRPLRVPMTWFAPRDSNDKRFEIDNFPVFIRSIDEHASFWGHGSVDGHDAKVGLDWDDNYQWTDADSIDRSVSQRDWENVAAAVEAALPGLNPAPSRVTTCMVTHSPDGQFIIGHLNDDSRILVGGGDSGHAFKHATGIGELIAQLVVGEEPYVNPEFVSPSRFAPGAAPTFHASPEPVATPLS